MNALATYVQRGRPNRATPPAVIYAFARYLHGLLSAGPLRRFYPEAGRVIAIGDVVPVIIRAGWSPYETTATVNCIIEDRIELFGYRPRFWVQWVNIADIPLEGPIWAAHPDPRFPYATKWAKREAA